MALHFLSHLWEVQDIDDGTLVKIKPEEVDAHNVSHLADELGDLVRESGRPNLELDFAAVATVPPQAREQLVRLEQQLHAIGGRLSLRGFDMNAESTDVRVFVHPDE